MRLALDTNILAYAEGINGEKEQRHAWTVLEKLSDCEVLIPVQVIGELFNVLIRKGKRTRNEACDAILVWRDSYDLIAIEEETTLAAAGLSARHDLGIWDAVILSAAARAGCRLLLSEDMHDGFTWSGTTVANPFLTHPHPLLTPHLRQ